jgi:hypothetical protein
MSASLTSCPAAESRGEEDVDIGRRSLITVGCEGISADQQIFDAVRIE